MLALLSSSRYLRPAWQVILVFTIVLWSFLLSYFILCFFFSSRRRHTRCLSDWSSDVCSSDLPAPAAPPSVRPAAALRAPRLCETRTRAALSRIRARGRPTRSPRPDRRTAVRRQIGRASCRERG